MTALDVEESPTDLLLAWAAGRLPWNASCRLCTGSSTVWRAGTLASLTAQSWEEECSTSLRRVTLGRRSRQVTFRVTSIRQDLKQPADRRKPT